LQSRGVFVFTPQHPNRTEEAAEMADDPLSNYVRARGAFARAEQELDRYAARVRGIAQRFTDDPRRFGFAGVKPALPDDLVSASRARRGGRSDVVPAHEWPAAAEIQQAVVSWHAARAAVAAAYDAIPRPQRGAVVPPDGVQDRGP
jgi:hypothetical protein